MASCIDAKMRAVRLANKSTYIAPCEEKMTGYIRNDDGSVSDDRATDMHSSERSQHAMHITSWVAQRRPFPPNSRQRQSTLTTLSASFVYRLKTRYAIQHDRYFPRKLLVKNYQLKSGCCRRGVRNTDIKHIAMLFVTVCFACYVCC